MANLSFAESDVIRERTKQRIKWSSEHDDSHNKGELLDAVEDLLITRWSTNYKDEWKLAEKHPEPRKRLVIAAALIIAEIERLDRLNTI